MFGEILERVRRQSPVIHNITNYVTANDCANMLLACGASPIMADDLEEAAEITSGCQGLNINIGTLNPQKLSAMVAAGRRANELGHPVVLDPVGVGVSGLRKRAAARLLEEVRFSAIRGNISEIRVLAIGGASSEGVGADAADKVTEENLEETLEFVKGFACKMGLVAAVTGGIDLVTDGERACCIRNGHPMMNRVTGTGCQLSALATAFLAVSPDSPFEAVAAAVCAMGLCGEIGYERMGSLDGNASYRNYMIDAMYRLTPRELKKGANYEMC